MVLLTPLDDIGSRPLRDAQLRWLAPQRPPDDALVFDIDDASLQAVKPYFGAWPFKRDVYALAVDQLRELGAHAIVIDLLLADSQAGDAALAQAIARPGAPVVLAAAGLRSQGDMPLPLPVQPAPGQLSDRSSDRSSDRWSDRSSAQPSDQPSGRSPGPLSSMPALPGDAPPTPVYDWPALALPAVSVWPPQGRPHLGVITTPADDDGVLRRLPLWHAAGGQRLPLLSLAVLQASSDPAPRPPQLDRSGALHLALPARPGWTPVLPFAELAAVALGQRAPAALRDQVRGRAVFIGNSSLFADRVMTVSGQTPGTVVLAQAYSALRGASWVRPPAPWAQFALLLLALAPAVVSVARGRSAPLRDIAAAGLALLMMVALAWTALTVWRQPTAWAAPLAALATGLACALWNHQRLQQARQRALVHDLAVAAETAKAKAAFLSNVSHEIRTPLNALLGVAELLADSPLTAQQRQHVQVFRESGQALHDLINDLLDLSKIEAGRLDVDVAPFALRPLLQHLHALMLPRAQGKGLQLRLEIAPGVPEAVLGDRKRLEQGLSNLMGNAIKFTARGEVRLRVAPSPGESDVLSFEVSDTGIGIAPSRLEAIFEPFAQADGSVTRQYGGTGLGLAITRSVAQLMGGEVKVRSTAGVGSTFALRLPLAPATLPTATAPAAPPPLAPARRLRVLLAEDNEVNVYIFRAMLDDQPVDLEVVADGPAALDRLRRRHFDLAFVDIQMPGMDGLSVTRGLREFETRTARPRTPVVALTANAFASDVQASLAAGCDRHLSKPVAKAALIQSLAELVPPGSPAGPDLDADANVDGATLSAPLELNSQAAIARLGGDQALYQRLSEHARVFIAGWPQSFQHACAEGDGDRARRLAHDLKGIAQTLGAPALTQAAADLEASIDPAAPRPATDGGRLDRLHAALTPVLVALSSSSPQPSR